MNQVAQWDDAGGAVRAESVPVDIAPGEALAVGREIAASADRVALFVMGDGSSALSLNAPGYLVPGAREWQDRVTAAMASADVDALAAISPDDAARMGAMGRAAWQVLAGAADANEGWHAELLAQDDRYGVAYLVALWTRQALRA
jgi:hypothetical protein